MEQSSGAQTPKPSHHVHSVGLGAQTRPVPPPCESATDTNPERPADDKSEEDCVKSLTDLKTARDDHLFSIHAIGLQLKDGDTLVYVDMPDTYGPYLMRPRDCNNVPFRSAVFRVDSQRLRHTGSIKFAMMLGPSYQFRIRRRRNVVNSLPEGVRYVIDLTPPSEGDDLVFQMTEASLTPGIIDWWTSYRYHDVPVGLVGGHDDVCCCRQRKGAFNGLEEDEYDLRTGQNRARKPLGTDVDLPPDPKHMTEYQSQGRKQLHEIPEFRKIRDYCPIRHRIAVIRLMLLLEGGEVPLDSANRVWTLVAVAKVLDCISLVRDLVSVWIMQERNTRFVEVLPEEALKIAYDLHLYPVTRTAFRILVNEMALRETATEETAPNARPDRRSTTIFGRRTGDCSDEISNLIQHAARALAERVKQTHHQLQSGDLLDHHRVREWGKLRRLEALLDHHESTARGAGKVHFTKAHVYVRRVMSKLGDVIRRKYKLVVDNIPDARDIDLDRATYVQPPEWEAAGKIMKKFNSIQHLLCPFVYSTLDQWLGEYFLTEGHPPRDGGGPGLHELCDLARRSIVHLVNHHPELRDSDQWQFVLDGIQGPLVDVFEMECDIRRAMGSLVSSWIRHDVEVPANITRHLLLTLNDEEMKYLPLWAGGLNDGTGGVFEAQIPATDMGPSGPGPAFHTGCTLPSAPASTTGSITRGVAELRVDTGPWKETVATKRSLRTASWAGAVNSVDSSWDAASSSSHQMDASDYREARLFVPVDRQSTCGSTAVVVEADMDSVLGDADSFASDMRDFQRARSAMPADDHPVAGDATVATEMDAGAGDEKLVELLSLQDSSEDAVEEESLEFVVEEDGDSD